ncbi:MAG: SPW repeat protein [Gemmataceae bacterium]
MRFISTRTHGVIDYAMGLFLIVSPWVLNFARQGAETWVPIVLGVGALGYSMLTRYELGVWPTIPMNVHLMLDAGSGIVLAISPWLFGFSSFVWIPHVVLGLMEVGSAFATETTPGTRTVHRGGMAGI